MAEKDELRGHAFDGIEEYDNDLPRWWLNIFWLTAIYSLGYIVWAHAGFKEADGDRLARRMQELQALQPAQEEATSTEAAGTSIEETLLQLTSDTAAVAKGTEIYTAKCAMCHGPDGGGLIGPNLTDQYWIHGGSLAEIRQVIINGVPEKGMLAWKTQLPPEDINAVTAYISTLQGTTPANPKAPEGDLVEGGTTAGSAPAEKTEGSAEAEESA